ncbi:MAG: flagellar motor switch protein FliM [Armatimonadota bacterium]
MNEVLSQEEIDALIESYKLATGSEDTGKSAKTAVRVYDFTRPDKFSKEHLRALNAIHSRHCSSLSAGLVSILRVEVQTELLALDQLTYREYIASVSESSLFAEVSLEPLAPTSIFEFSPSLVGICVDLLAGAPGVSEVYASRITDIDKELFRPIIEMVLKRYSDVWASSVVFKPRIDDLFTDATTKQVLLPTEGVLVCSYEVTMMEHSHLMSICIPASAIEAILPALEMGKSSLSSAQKSEVNEAIKKSFVDVELECKAILGRTELPLSDLMSLEVGDLIRLPIRQDSPTELWIDDVPSFAGTLGRSGRNLAIKITGPLASDDTN